MNRKQMIVILGLAAYIAGGLIVVIFNPGTFIRVLQTQAYLFLPILQVYIPILILGILLFYLLRDRPKAKILLILLLGCCITTGAYAGVNFLNRAFYEKIILKPIHRYVLVNRLSGQVEYIMRTDNRWAPVQKPFRNQYQAMYDRQVAASQ